MTAWKQAVARAFSGADGYDDAASVQALVARRLAEAVAAEPLGLSPRILEVGCGTGLLTQALRARFPTGRTIATDLSPAMLARARARLGVGPGLAFVAMDGECPGLLGPFDLVASSLAAQWFENLPDALAGLAGLLAPGGLLAVATLAAGTFREWQAAHAVHGLRAATPAYPEAAALRALKFPDCETRLHVFDVADPRPEGRAFLQALRRIGAHVPTPGRPPLPAGRLRRILRSFEAEGGRATYRVALLLVRRAEAADGSGAPAP